MLEQILNVAFIAIGTYTVVGIVAALYFHLRVLPTLDKSTEGAGILFRILITPGLVALWPLILQKTRVSCAAVTPEPFTPRQLRALHGLLIIIASILLPIALGAALYSRQLDSASTSMNGTAKP